MKSDSVHQAVAHDEQSASELAASPVVGAATTTQDALSVLCDLIEGLESAAFSYGVASPSYTLVKFAALNDARDAVNAAIDALSRQVQPAVEIQRGTV